MKVDPINPKNWARPSGYSNASLARGATAFLFVAGQIAWDENQKLVGAGDFVAQFRQALSNVRTVVRAGGAYPSDIVRLTLYVVDKQQYLSNLKEIGVAYSEVLGRSYPAMSLVQVAGLLEDDALVEIEATAAIG